MILSYNVDELFRFEKNEDGYTIAEYLKKDAPEITEVEIPAEYKGEPVTTILGAFFSCDYIQEVYIPDSVNYIGDWSFYNCPELRTVRLPKHVIIEYLAFEECKKLAAEIIMAGIVGSPEDISAPIGYFIKDRILLNFKNILRSDVFELVVKYDSFREIGMDELYARVAQNNLFAYFEMLENANRAPNAAQTDSLIEWCVQNETPEMAAYLLEYKKRKFGFTKFGEGDNFEL